jgi:hypothetical protein
MYQCTSSEYRQPPAEISSRAEFVAATQLVEFDRRNLGIDIDAARVKGKQLMTSPSSTDFDVATGFLLSLIGFFERSRRSAEGGFYPHPRLAMFTTSFHHWAQSAAAPGWIPLDRLPLIQAALSRAIPKGPYVKLTPCGRWPATVLELQEPPRRSRARQAA